MAYGTEDTTQVIFDRIISDDVFREVTSISLDEFRFLRNGGTYIDPETGEQGFYEGKLFDDTELQERSFSDSGIISKLSPTTFSCAMRWNMPKRACWKLN